MMNLGPHAHFILIAYGLAVLTLTGLIAWVWLDYRAQKNALGELEARGVTRRSSRAAESLS
jgi:heme exporter protein D